ncbi:hypothetical protein StoSoilB3_06680 [Arthrobacter sp. StoSoilB3]|nr:hypothetical protein ASF74_13215 [Arthrobacter sp. Leaf145]BCW39133.1 hypothetical protein StoSoilB3_06680 [Arthrobacter sp. StoSoilB3]
MIADFIEAWKKLHNEAVGRCTVKDPVAEHATETVVAVILHDDSVPQLESGTTLNGAPGVR